MTRNLRPRPRLKAVAKWNRSWTASYKNAIFLCALCSFAINVSTLRYREGVLRGSSHAEVQKQLVERGRVREVRRLQAGIPRLSKILAAPEFLSPGSVDPVRSEYARTRSSGTRGILIVAGGPTSHLGNALVSLRILRESLACSLPVEIVYFGEGERDPFMQNLLLKQVPNVTFIDGNEVPYPKHHFKVPITGYAAKIFALCYVTSFQEVLMVDADSMPLIDPREMFDIPEFRSKGNIFWPDYWSSPDEDNSGHEGGALLYRALRMRPPWATNPNHRLTESGQVLIDRERHAEVLEWLWYLNSHSDIVYKHLHGDKDTFLLAFHLAGKSTEFHQVTIPPREAVNDLSEPKEYPYRHQGILQHLPDGRLAFHHRTAPDVKFFPGCGMNSLPNWCQVAYISTPLSVLQARGLINKTHEGRFSLTEFDAMAAHRLACKGARDINSPPPSAPTIPNFIQRRGGKDVVKGYLLSDYIVPLVPKCDDFCDAPEESCPMDVHMVYRYVMTTAGQLNAELDTGQAAAAVPIFRTRMYKRIGPLLDAAFQIYRELKVVVDSTPPPHGYKKLL